MSNRIAKPSLGRILHDAIRKYEREHDCAVVQIDVLISDDAGEPPIITVLVETRETFETTEEK